MSGLISLGGVSQTINNISNTEKKTAKTLEKLSTGKTVNRGSDGAALLGKIKALGSEIDGLEQANRNINSGSHMLDVASGAQNQILSSLQELQSLSVQAADETLSSQDREAITQRAGQLVSDIDRMSRNTDFGGRNLLDGSFSNQSVQVGSGSGQTVEVSIESHTSTALGVDGVDLSSAATSGNAITTIDAAINSVMSSIGNVAATQNRFAFAEEANASQILSETEAKSELEDLDYAKATADLTQKTVSRKAGAILLSKSLSQEKDNADRLSLKL